MISKYQIVSAAVLGACIALTACQGSSSSSPKSVTLNDPKARALDADYRAKIDRMCKATGNLAETVMEGRQNGLTLSTALGFATTPESRAMTLRAYDQERFYSAAGKRRAEVDFRNSEELRCQKAYK